MFSFPNHQEHFNLFHNQNWETAHDNAYNADFSLELITPKLDHNENDYSHLVFPEETKNHQFTKEEEECMTEEEIENLKETEKMEEEIFIDLVSTYFCENGPEVHEETFQERYPIFYRVFTEPLDENQEFQPQNSSDEISLLDMLSEFRIE